MPYSIRIDFPHQREQALRLVNVCPDGSWVSIRESVRTGQQNKRMWAMLSQVALQLDWHGVKYTPEDWKDFFCHAMKADARWMPAEDGGAIPLGLRTSKMSKDQLNDLMLLIEAFAARHGVDLGDAEEAA